MPAAALERAHDNWRLESFLDSLILELDKAQDTLAIKGVTRRLTYTVKDLSLDLYVFPDYDGKKLRFNVARPGENGASRISFQLGSITDRQIRESANELTTSDDMPIDQVEGLDDDIKRSLERAGITSARDLDRLGQRRIDVSKVVADKTGGEKSVSYDKLADMIAKARRRKIAPQVMSLGARRDGDDLVLALSGQNLSVDHAHGFPMAVLNGERVPVIAARPHMVALRLRPGQLKSVDNDLKVALDPYAVITLQVSDPTREESK